MSSAWGPLTRTIPTPPAVALVASAQMVSVSVAPLGSVIGLSHRAQVVVWTS